MRFAFVIGIALLCLVSCSVMKYIPAVTAAKYYEQGDYANAIQYYLKSVSDGDRRAETFYWLGMSFYKHGDLEDAMLALEMSLEKDTTDVVVLERLAAVNLDLGNFRKAGFYCQKAILVDKQYVEVYNTLAHVFYEGGQLDSAEYYFKYVLTLSKSLRWESLAMKTFVSYADLNAEALNGLGEICIRRGSLFRALDYFGAANSLANNWETPWFNKGRAYEALGNTHAAEIAYERTIDLAPGKTWACKNLARMYHSLHRNSEAMTLYRRAMRIDSTDVESYFGIAELYEENGDKKVAADFYNRAVDKNPDDPRAYSRAARANMLIGKYDVAMELLNEVLQLQPQDADAYNALGEAYRATGDTLQAEKAFEDAIAADSLFAPPLRNLGEILLKRGKESEGLGLHIRAARLGDVKAAEFLRSRGLGWK